MTYRVAIIGSGNMARTHTRGWSKIREAEIAGYLDRDKAYGEKLAAELGVPCFSDLDTMLARLEPDIIDICAPTPAHKELAIAAAKAGKNVFLEKPMARTLADCDEIIRVVQETGIMLMVGHVVRFFPEYAAAKRMIDGGGVGEPAAIRCARVSSHPRGSVSNWYADPGQSGGVILDMIIHDFDWMRWCFRDVERVYAKGLYGKSDYKGSLDYGLVTLKFKSGALGHVCGSWAHTGGFRTTFEVCGDAGMIEHDSARSVPLTIGLRQSNTGGSPGVTVPESPLFPLDDPYYLELRHFVDCLTAKKQPTVTLQDARAAVQIALAALESIETGMPVTLR
jgi:predicted dehydrogenase